MTKDVLYRHTCPPPFTVGQLRAALARLPAEMPIQVSIPDEPGSSFADDGFIVIAAEQVIEVHKDQQIPVDLCVIAADFPSGEYYLPEGHPR